MKLILVRMMLGLLAMCFSTPGAAASAAKSATQASQADAKAGGKGLGTNFDFEDQLIRGKYEYPDEAVATVEDEKLLNDLLSIRKDFKDRLQEMSFRR